MLHSLEVVILAVDVALFGVAVFELAEVGLALVANTALVVELHCGADRCAGVVVLLETSLATVAFECARISRARDD